MTYRTLPEHEDANHGAATMPSLGRGGKLFIWNPPAVISSLSTVNAISLSDQTSKASTNPSGTLGNIVSSGSSSSTTTTAAPSRP